MQRLSGFVVILIAFLLLPGVSGAKPLNQKLSINEDKWKKTFFVDHGYSSAPGGAASFQIGNDPVYGPFLKVGPWTAGKWSARFQYKDKLPLTEAVIRGRYRTSDIKPFECAVYIEFYQSGKRISKSDYVLTPAEQWTPFEIPVKNPPQGTDVISPGFGLKQKSEGHVMFTDLVISTVDSNSTSPEELPQVARLKPAGKFKKGNFFSLTKDANQAWWFVTPGGDPFYSLATVGPSIKEPYDLRRYYARSIREMGFNSLAGWTGLKGWERLNNILEKEGNDALPVFYTMSTDNLEGRFDYLVDSRGRAAGDGGHKFPDPFDPGFVEVYRKEVRKTVKIVGEKKWFIGWFADNEISHSDVYRHVYSRHCNESFRKWLKGRYHSVDALNKAWGTQFGSFEVISESRPTPASRSGSMYEDFRKFQRIIVARYIDVTTDIIREEDPGRLLFSNRFMLSDSSDWLPLLDLYSVYDGIAINLYPSNISPGLSESEKLLLKMAHEKSGRPIIVTEWSVPALDSGLYDDIDNLDWSFSRVVRTQSDRARQAAHVTLDFYNQPYIIGSHWFRWNDYYSVKRMANRGLVQSDGQPWTELQEALKNVNNKLR
jgi:hypothetical protein